MGFLSTFRGRLLLTLAFLLLATLGVQYYLNLRTQRDNTLLREAQEQAIVAGIALGFTSMTSKDYRLQDLIEQPEQTFLDVAARERIRDIIIIDNEWQVTDSLDPDLLPQASEDGVVTYKKLGELSDLPPLLEGARLGEDIKYFPNRKSDGTQNNSDEAHAVPIETSQGRWYVMVLLKNDKDETAWRAAQPLLFTLGILLVASLMNFLLVWRFTRPVAYLSDAARRVADGDLDVRVPDADRADEMGRLAARFNEMTAELSKKRDIEAQLQQAEKSAVVGRLGSAIAHEIRNPLNYINLTLDHLRSKFAPEDPDRGATFAKLTAQLKDEVARINQQITDFLNYSRPATATPQPLNARKIVEDSLRLVEAQAEENNINITVAERGHVPLIMGDPEFLRSVFNNLFINAVQALGAAGGSIKVEIAPEPEMVLFEITDSGSGISVENLEKIFEPYFSTKETGTGLGLAIVQKIVEGHRGSITVESEPGSGTTFRVRIPSA